MCGTGPSGGQQRPPVAPDSQWRPAPPPGGVTRLPGLLRLRRGCAGQAAAWSGFLVRRVRPAGTLAGAGAWNAAGGNDPHCLVTRVCKRQCLSVGPYSPLPDWGWLSLLPDSLQGPRREKTTATSLQCYQDMISFSSGQPSEVAHFMNGVVVQAQ